MFNSLKGAKEWATNLLDSQGSSSAIRNNLDHFLEEVNAGKYMSIFEARVLYGTGGGDGTLGDSLCSPSLALPSVLFSVPYHVFIILINTFL